MARFPELRQTFAVGFVSYLLVYVFIGASANKLASMEMAVANFAQWGYPAFFLYVVGAVEALAVILIALPRTRFFGSLYLAVVMIGAIVTHATAGEFASLPIPLLLLGLSSGVSWATRPKPLFHTQPLGSARFVAARSLE